MHGVAVYCANTAKLHRSQLQSSKGKRSNIHVGLAATTPPLWMPHTFRADNRSQDSFFFLRSRPMPRFTERTMLAVCLCHMVNDHSQRVCHPLSPTCHVCLDKADAACRREVGMARFTMLTVLCLWYLIFSILIYGYNAIRIGIYLY